MGHGCPANFQVEPASSAGETVPLLLLLWPLLLLLLILMCSQRFREMVLHASQFQIFMGKRRLMKAT